MTAIHANLTSATTVTKLALPDYQYRLLPCSGERNRRCNTPGHKGKLNGGRGTPRDPYTCSTGRAWAKQSVRVCSLARCGRILDGAPAVQLTEWLRKVLNSVLDEHNWICCCCAQQIWTVLSPGYGTDNLFAVVPALTDDLSAALKALFSQMSTVIFGRYNGEGMECSIHATQPSLCSCGQSHWPTNKMAVVVHSADQICAIGPGCVRPLRAAGVNVRGSFAQAWYEKFGKWPHGYKPPQAESAAPKPSTHLTFDDIVNRLRRRSGAGVTFGGYELGQTGRRECSIHATEPTACRSSEPYHRVDGGFKIQYGNKFWFVCPQCAADLPEELNVLKWRTNDGASRPSYSDDLRECRPRKSKSGDGGTPKHKRKSRGKTRLEIRELRGAGHKPAKPPKGDAKARKAKNKSKKQK